MTRPEEPRAGVIQTEVTPQELRGRIVRAQSWNQLFPTDEAAQVDFKTSLVDDYRFYYIKDDPTVVYIVESNPDGDIHRVIRNKGYDKTFQRLTGGDIRIVSYNPHRPESVDLITPNIGNIDHPYTQGDIVTLNEEMLSDSDALISSWLKGKPATQGWEDTMLHNGHLPQRIGHRLFPHTALERLNQIKERSPQLIAAPSVNP